MRKLRTVTAMDIERIGTAYDKLGEAVSYLRDAGATKAAARLATGRKSVMGAYRHAERCFWRQHGKAVNDV